MRILHLRNIANTHNLVTAQRALGHDVELWSTGHPERKLNKFPVDDNNPYTDPVRWNLWMLSRLKKLQDFDVLHVHGGIWRSWLMYKFIKTPLAIHYHGTELRMAVGHYYRDIAKIRFISTPDDLRWIPDGIWLPQPIEIPPEPVYETQNERPVFVHFYLRDNTKRTPKIIEMFNDAFGPLEYKSHGPEQIYTGKDAELRIYHAIPPTEVLRIMCAADVVFDQMTFYRVYGAVSAEAMANGKPTLVPIDRALFPSDCPVIVPSVPKLMELAYDADARIQYGRMGRAYVERVHDRNVVAKKAIDAYEEYL